MSFIGTPDFQKLVAMRAKKSNLSDTPPTVPGSLRARLQRVDPAAQPYREAGPQNPFFGKKICACSGADDTLVRFSYSQEFLENLVVAPPGSDEARRSLQVYVQPNTGHTVTSESTFLGSPSAPHRCPVAHAVGTALLICPSRHSSSVCRIFLGSLFIGASDAAKSTGQPTC